MTWWVMLIFGALVDVTGVNSTIFMLLFDITGVSLVWMYSTQIVPMRAREKQPHARGTVLQAA